MKKKKILFLSANPIATERLLFDQEFREIKEGIKRAKYRDSFELSSDWAVTADSMRRALLDEQPDIVHFSGHGSRLGGIAVESTSGAKYDIIKPEPLGRLFKIFSDSVHCVILNACYSEKQADAIAKYIPYVVGMIKDFQDKSAVKFSMGFYDALGAGKDILKAFEIAKNSIELAGLNGEHIPIIKQLKSNTIMENLDTATPTKSSEAPEFVNAIYEDNADLSGIKENVDVLLNKFKETSKHKELASYLDQTRGTVATKMSNKLLDKLSEEDKKQFQRELVKLLRLVHDGLLANSLLLVEEPEIRLSFDIPLYQEALERIKTKIINKRESFLEDSLQFLADCFDHLIEELG